jgi:hypothetical protein
MTNQITSEEVMALIQQNQQLLQLMAAKEIGHTHNNEEWESKANDMLMDMITKAPANTMTAQKLHGLTGTFSTFGLDRDIISTHVAPHGIAGRLPMLPNNDEDPRYGALTGFSDDIGNEPAEPCDDAPTGFIKACNLTAQFGRVARTTETIEMDKLGLRINRGDFMDLVLHGMNLNPEQQGGLMPRGLDKNQILNNVTMSQMVSVGVRMSRLLSNHIWQGSPANNNAGGGYREFPGLDNQIATGQVDADSGTACVSLDSDVKDFAYQNVDGSGNRDIVEYLSMLEYFIWTLANDTGMLPAKWVFVMRPQLWHELSRVWPIIYNTDKVAISLAAATNARVVINGRENIEERDRMRQMGTLVVNGRTYPVIEDTGIFESNNINNANLAAGEFASSIYMLPLTVTGNFPVTFRQHIDYRNSLLLANTRLLRGNQNFWTDAGIFSWAFEDVKWCWTLTAKTEQRVVLRTPQLAGRIDNVMYSPLQHLREADPDSAYWVDGGVSLRSEPSKNAVWL